MATPVNMESSTQIDDMDRPLFFSDQYILAVEIQMHHIQFLVECDGSQRLSDKS
jgi:hypothetical protein